MTTAIRLTYRAVDGFTKSGTFKTLAGARKAADGDTYQSTDKRFSLADVEAQNRYGEALVQWEVAPHMAARRPTPEEAPHDV